MINPKLLPQLKLQLPDDFRNCRLGSPPLALQPMDKNDAKIRFEDWLDSANQSCSAAKFEKMANDDDLKSFLSAVFDLSPYLYGLAMQYPQTVWDCSNTGFHNTLSDNLAQLAGYDHTDTEIMCLLRIVKKKAALICGLADLGGWWSWEHVSRGISMTADYAVQTTVNHLLLQAHNNGKLLLPDLEQPSVGSGYAVLAMGKHGADELNYSSDIDLIVMFDPDVPSIPDRDESVALFVRLTKALVKILQERTADGYVFRTDLRLRPDPGSMPLAIPLPLALNYYESRGQNWERAALIKARPVAGDISLGSSILKELRPFIWRRYLDFAAISDVHSIKRQIQSHRGLTEGVIPGLNIKLGRGGIREIEFFVQTQQLIAGGRNPSLRGKRTVETLNSLAVEKWIDQQTADEMAASYGFLRDVEHRLQMISDAQTHSLPQDKTDLLRVAKLSGLSKVRPFKEILTRHLENVERHYSALFEQGEDPVNEQGHFSFTGDDDDPGTLQTLSRLGFVEPSRAIDLVRGWYFGRYAAVQSEKAREQLALLAPSLLEAFARTGRADDTLLAFDEFVQGLPAGIQLFAILRENPKILVLLSAVLGSAPRLAQIITRRPHVFDGVLEPGFIDHKPEKAHWQDLLDRSLQQAVDYEDGLDRVRVFAAEHKFLTGMRFLSGAITPAEMASEFSSLAETLLLAMSAWVLKSFEEAHGLVPGARFALVGMGNLGTGELTASSDLDLMLVYEFFPDHEESDGKRSLHASQYYGRFAQRLIAAMSAATSQGVVYELDFRLRPNGKDGPIATSLRAFENHYAESAWTWERLALTRARVLGAPDDFTCKVEMAISAAIADTTGDPKPIAKVVKDVLDMRKLMDKERPAASTWDVKLAKGGMVDIEFLTQTAALLGKTPARGASRVVLASQITGISEVNKTTLREAHANYFDVVQILRLCLDGATPLETAPRGMIELLLKHLDFPDIRSSEAFLKDKQRAVRKLFLQLTKSFGTSL